MPKNLLGYELEDWLPQEFWQGPPLPEWVNIHWPWYTTPGAEFRVSNLVLSPTEVNPGQVVTISIFATNIGSEAGEYIVKLGGDFMAERQITLNPGESMTVSFQVVPDMAKIYNVSVDGLYGSFTATEAAVADIRVEDLSISPAEVMVGETVTISCRATNYGTAPGTKKIVCTVT